MPFTLIDDVRTSFLHLADTRVGFRDPDDPEVFQRVAQQFRFAIDFAIDQRASFVVFSGQLFAGGDLEPEAFQVALRGLQQLAAKNITAIAVRGRCELPLSNPRTPNANSTWHDVLSQEGLLASLEADATAGPGQLGLKRWERREGRGSFVDLGRCRVFGLHYVGSMADVLLPALAKAIGAQDNREADFKLVLLPGVLENCSPTFGPKLSHSDLHLFRRNLDYVALGGCDGVYESEGWVYNPGCEGFYHVTVDTAVQPKHNARYVAYPPALTVIRPAQQMQRPNRRDEEQRVFDELVSTIQHSTPGAQDTGVQRGVVRLVTQTMWGDARAAELRMRLLEAAAGAQEPGDAA